MHEELNRMQDYDVVKPYKSLLLLVSEKNETFLFCADYRQLNAVTHKNAYLLSYMSLCMAVIGRNFLKGLKSPIIFLI